MRMVRLNPFFACALLLSAAPAAASTPEFERQVAKVRAIIMENPERAASEAQALRRMAANTADAGSRKIDQAVADRLEAEALLSLNRPAAAMQAIERGLAGISGVRSRRSVTLRGELLLARGGVAELVGRVADALRDNQQAYNLLGASGDKRGQAIALLNIGALYSEAGDYVTAIRYYDEAVEAYSADPRLLLSAANNRGNALFELKRYGQAERAHQDALKIARQLGNPLMEVRILQNLASTQAEARKFDEADRTLARAFWISRSGPAVAWRPALSGVAARIALRRNDLVGAEARIRETFGENQPTVAMPLRDFHHTAYEIYRRRGDPAKALEHLEAFKTLDDEARSLAASTNAALMGARFDFANQNLKIAERDATIARANARFQNMLTVGLLSAAALVTLLLAIGFVSIRRSRNQVRAANASLTITNAALERALAAKTEFLATTSHEIRTPLNGILGMTQVILAGRQLDPTLRGRIELVHGAGETMRALVDDILDMAKIETGELRVHPVEMDLHRLLEEAAQVWTGQAETKRIAIEYDLGDVPPRIVADEVRLRQIVFNLMSNAVKFTDRGRVRLAASVDERDAGEILLIAVDDSGMGVPPDRQEEIFDSFRQIDGGVTRRHGGTGLGLAICRNLARAMGGDVTLVSTLGAGSTFTLEVPLVRAAAAPEPGRRPAAAHLADAELLVIDANPLAQGVMRALLAGETGSLLFVSDLEQALAHLEKRGADHVLADGAALNLDSDAVSALAEAARAARARLTLLWPNPSPAQIAELTARGANQLLAKPISATELLPALKLLYDAAAADREIAA
jgi:signal transduction histidine kinase/BarA-like signal transduction histidine kinase